MLIDYIIRKLSQFNAAIVGVGFDKPSRMVADIKINKNPPNSPRRVAVILIIKNAPNYPNPQNE